MKLNSKSFLLRRCLIAVVGLACAVPPAAAANLLVNGSFEDPIVPDDNPYGWINVASGSTIGTAGWVVAQNSVDVHSREYGTKWNCADGLQALDLTGGNEGIIYQDVPVTPGMVYSLSFHLSANLAGGSFVSFLAVYADGSLLDTVSFDSAGATFDTMNWQFHSFDILAPDDVLRVTFQSLIPGNCGPAIDRVQLEMVEIPEPATAAAWTAVAVAGYAALRRKRGSA